MGQREGPDGFVLVSVARRRDSSPPSMSTNLTPMRSLALRGLAGLSFAVGTGYAALVCLMAWEGGPWAHGIYAERPLAHLAGAVVFFFAGYVLRRGYRNSTRDWLRFAGRTVLLTISLALSLLAAEIGLRAYLEKQQVSNSMERLKSLRRQGRKAPFHSTHPLAKIIEPSPNPALVYELQPGLDVDFGHVRVRTNRQGMRDSHEYAEGRAPGRLRIIGIGDSGMFGWGVEQDEDYLAVLESNLNVRADGPRCDVLNMAVPGYNTQLEVESLRSKGLAYRPDIVIVGWCENDFGLPFFLLQKQNYWRRDLSYLYCLLFDRKRFREISPLLMRDRREFDSGNVMPELSAGTDVEGVRRALLDLKSLGAREGFHVLVFGPMRTTVVSLCQKLQVPYYSTIERIPAGRYPESYEVHFMHPRPQGHRVLAEHLARELESLGWLAPVRGQTNQTAVATGTAGR